MAKKTDAQRLLDWEKIRRACPCAYQDGRHYRFPDVDCELKCKSCDWNPAEHERRMKSGTTVFNRVTKVKTLYFKEEKQ